MSIESYFLLLRSTGEKTLHNTPLIPYKKNYQCDQNVYELLLEVDFLSIFNLFVNYFNLDPKTKDTLEITPEMASNMILVLDYMTSYSWSRDKEKLFEFNPYFSYHWKNYSETFYHRFDPSFEVDYNDEDEEIEVLKRVLKTLRTFLFFVREHEFEKKEIRLFYKVYHT